MEPTQRIRIVLAIAAALLCGTLTRAQDANSSWLLGAPQVSGRQILDLSAARIDPTRLQSLRMSQCATETDPTQTSTSSTTTTILPAEHRFWDTTNDLL